MVHGLLRVHPLSRCGVSMSKTRPEFGIILQLQTTFEGLNGLRPSSFLFVGATKKVIVEPIVWIEVDRITQLLDGSVPLMREDKDRAQISIPARRKWINSKKPAAFLHRLVISSHRRQKPGIVAMSVATIGIDLNRALEFSFGCSPIPLVPLVLDGQNYMRLGVGFVQGDGLRGEFSRSGGRFLGSDKPVVLVNVVIGEGTISASVAWVQR